MLYDVSVSRISTATKTIRVEASSTKEAETKAVEQAHDESFEGCVVEYDFECNSTNPVTDPGVPPNPLQDALTQSLPEGYRYLKTGETVKDSDKRWETPEQGFVDKPRWAEVPPVCVGTTVYEEKKYIRFVPPETCALCGAVMPDDIDDAIDAGWIPSYFIGDEEQDGPVCPNCDTQFIRESKGGESELSVEGEYVSVWDGGVEVRSKCVCDPHTRKITITKPAQDTYVELLEKEYVVLNGKEYSADNEDHRYEFTAEEQKGTFFYD